MPGPITGARTTPSAYSPSACPCFSGGKLSSRMLCDSGCKAPPAAPWMILASRIVPSVGARPQATEAMVKMTMDVIR